MVAPETVDVGSDDEDGDNGGADASQSLCLCCSTDSVFCGWKERQAHHRADASLALELSPPRNYRPNLRSRPKARPALG